MPLSLVTLEATVKQTSTLIFMHGLGDTGHGWSSALDAIRPTHMKIICPTAPIRPVTINHGYKMPAWFDLKTPNKLITDDEEGVKTSSKNIHQIIIKEIENGISSNRILLGGFSQGGAIALYSALTFTKPLGCVIALSSYLPMYDQFQNYRTISDDLPIFQAHGDSDTVVAHKFGKLSANLLKTHMKNVTFKTYVGLQHTSTDEEINDVKNFIEKCVGI